MVAGASGLDLVMLVVAADEGVMPQTREHLAICELLGVERGLVVLTKSDLVPDIAPPSAEVRDATRGTAFADAPLVPVSALQGDGLDELRAQIGDLLAALPPRSDDGSPRLAVDRVLNVLPQLQVTVISS